MLIEAFHSRLQKYLHSGGWLRPQPKYFAKQTYQNLQSEVDTGLRRYGLPVGDAHPTFPFSLAKT
ncbi:MAG: hypothetical protein WAU62_08675 [Dehalococcoidales bacterium]|jgi:hypothetical protein